MTVSVVIPCYNPKAYLLEAIASVRAQTWGGTEVIVVDDGTHQRESLEIVEAAGLQADRLIRQPNRGLPAARNAGFRAACGPYVVPLDADDLLRPEFVAVCMDALERDPGAAFAYADCEVFGTENYIDRLPDYNLYRLLDVNTITYASVIRKPDWDYAGGYDEAMRCGYEDWEFWLRLGSRGRFGRHTPGALFRYRKHGPSLLSQARARHDEIVAYIRTKHPCLYADEPRGRLKAQWEPIVCIVASDADHGRQTIYDCETQPSAGLSRATALLFPGKQPLDPTSAELAALAVWGGRERVVLADGSVALARQARMAARQSTVPAIPQKTARYQRPLPWENLRRHLVNAELLSARAWRRNPVGLAARLIPLRMKERVNRMAGRPLFDLTFYLRFQPKCVELPRGLPEPLVYLPRSASSRRRIALITAQLGPGGAEQVLLDIAKAIACGDYEVFLIATQSGGDRRWLGRWEEVVERIYDLEPLVDAARMPGAVYSTVANWQPDTVLLQNSLAAYSVIPHWKERRPGMRVIDLIHAVDSRWNVLEATQDVASGIDVRVAVSETVRQHLLARGFAPEKLRLIRSGVDAERFAPVRKESGTGPHRVLFAGRLNPVKRPLLLVEIASALRRRRHNADFRFVVAGDGPEAGRLAHRIGRRKLECVFELLGHVPDIAPELARCDLPLLPSESEGIPLVVLEAFASAKPVVATAVGGVPEVVRENNGFAIPANGREVQAFAEAIDTLLRNPELRQAMGEHGRSMVMREFSHSASREAYRALFRME